MKIIHIFIITTSQTKLKYDGYTTVPSLFLSLLFPTHLSCDDLVHTIELNWPFIRVYLFFAIYFECNTNKVIV